MALRNCSWFRPCRSWERSHGGDFVFKTHNQFYFRGRDDCPKPQHIKVCAGAGGVGRVAARVRQNRTGHAILAPCRATFPTEVRLEPANAPAHGSGLHAYDTNRRSVFHDVDDCKIAVVATRDEAPKAPRICSVVVTYNRRALLLECLDALWRQTVSLAGLCLVDNASSDGTAESLRASGYLDVLPPAHIGSARWLRRTEIKVGENRVAFHYLRMPKNLGGAGGFFAGMEWAEQAGYDGLWLMDDDAKPSSDALARLLAHWDEPEVFALAGAVTDGDGLALSHRGHFDFRFSQVFPLLHNPVPEHLYAQEILDIDMASFVGLLVRTDAIRQTGLPREDFFLHNDDAEYCIRLRKHGRILLVPGSKIEHKEARRNRGPSSKWLCFSSARPPYNRLWMNYYHLRNVTWLGKTYHKSSPRFFSAVLTSWLRAVTSVLLFDRDHRWRRARFLTSAYLDGLRGVFDNAKPRRILYGREETDH